MPELITEITQRIAVATFDVERDGGGVGNRELVGDVVPAGAIVVDALVRIDEVFRAAVAAPKREMVPTIMLRLAGVSLTDRPIAAGHASWVPGRVKRSTLTAGASHIAATGHPVVAGITEPGSGGFTAGRLTVVISYIDLPPG